MKRKAVGLSEADGWSCDERDRAQCRNAHGCHCREITELLYAKRQKGDDAFYRWIDKLISAKRRGRLAISPESKS